jgi:hypothetical protein
MVKPLLDEAEITVSSPFLAILWHLYQPMSMEGISATLADQYRESPGWSGDRAPDHAFRRGNWRPLPMAKSKRKRAPKTVLKLPDLEQSKSAVLNSLTSTSSKRSYDHTIREFIDW